MENRTHISEELKEISPFIAAIAPFAPYTVPQGYFEALPAQVMLRIGLNEKSGADPLLAVSKQTPYEVPVGYFDTLAANILEAVHSADAAQPDQELTTLAGDRDKKMPFATPDGYFESFAGQLMNRIKAMETDNVKDELELLSPLLGKLERKTPFTPPAGYFEDISENIVAGIKAIDFVNEELENLSPLMRELKDKQVFELPAGYFDQTAPAILDRIRQTEKPSAAKLVSMSFGKKMIRYAAAALVAGIVVVAGFMFFNKQENVQQPLAGIKTNWDSARVATIPDQEIETFLKTNAVTLADVSDDNTATDTDLKDLLADVSDEELQQYLEQHGVAPNSITN